MNTEKKSRSLSANSLKLRSLTLSSFIGRAFTFTYVKIILTLYNSSVHPHLEYDVLQFGHLIT